MNLDNELNDALLEFIERKNIDRIEIVFDAKEIKKVVVPDEKKL